jgi:dTMP kinase
VTHVAAGKFITFEGGEGSGKSTQAKLLAKRLRERGLEVVLTREPGGSPFAEQLRALILAPNVAEHSALSEALLFYAARADHLAKLIRPALAAGRWVVCDRFSDSTRVYQSLAGDLPEETFGTLERIVVAPTVPDFTVILDLPPDEGLVRALARRGANAQTAADRYEGRGIGFHARLREAYLDIARSEPRRCVIINATPEPQTVSATVWAAIVGRLLRESG